MNMTSCKIPLMNIVITWQWTLTIYSIFVLVTEEERLTFVFKGKREETNGGTHCFTFYLKLVKISSLVY